LVNFLCKVEINYSRKENLFVKNEAQGKILFPRPLSPFSFACRPTNKVDLANLRDGFEERQTVMVGKVATKHLVKIGSY
jgi:hypothetical protein